MSAPPSNQERPERRSEQRSASERYYSVQFTTQGLASVYQFKLRNISAKGMCILVKEDSEILSHINVDDVLEMTYYLADGQGANETLQTQIKHITKSDEGRFEGHYLVGLSITENK